MRSNQKIHFLHKAGVARITFRINVMNPEPIVSKTHGILIQNITFLFSISIS